MLSLVTSLLFCSALRLLKESSKGPTSYGLCGLEPTIQYLQNLGKENLPLILEYSKAVIRVSLKPGSGLGPWK